MSSTAVAAAQNSGTRSRSWAAPLSFSFLPAYRVLMVWVYDRTGSVLVAMLMHVSLTASTLILQPLDVAGTRRPHS